jgi:hypothetical protein
VSEGSIVLDEAPGLGIVPELSLIDQYRSI